MTTRAKTLLSAFIIGLVACGVMALQSVPSRSAQNPAKTSALRDKRDLLLQPEALKLARRLGMRFLSDGPTTSVLSGTLTIGSETQVMQMTRTQTDEGETVEIRVAGRPEPLSWDAQQGMRALSRQPSPDERELVERLVFDSPDQFVLMQLRGASYYIVARAVRPAGANDGYDGPLWTIVRIDDPEQDEAKRPASRWRLYYLNTVTGLVDRIESEVEGRRIVAQISSWTEQHGEKLPAQIVWTRDGQTLMQYSLTNFSHSQNQGVAK